MVRANVTDDVAAGIDEIKMELASNAHHVFRFTLDGKHVPSVLADAIARVQNGYQPAAHEALGPSANAALLDAEPAFTRLSRGSASGRSAQRPPWPTSFAAWWTRGSAASW